ncbi:MXAN_2562 family outer membrane beta-barrel protein [Polyangium mundeleinium]|uniref:MXAN_2562 family outer membrane beta-barrel protein n=1 Tax=Polyangium mundeleinium TaxID=2995306 RepID=A0ABT5EYI5_9BACT|nr:MXAN_2562 family outer membrane beta-barrel protein [Polyangium mundeleinium]MDC0746899.1 MXAN_2562 family outer membrane beta-barrel protein [Polyangium mundeleinium]
MRTRMLVSALAGIVALFAAEGAEAQTKRIRDSNWRQSERGSVQQGSPQRFALEFRFGLYYPAVDEEFGGTGPYSKFFGDKGRFHFGGEFDWQALRIPYVGSFGPGVGIGYTSATGKAFREGTYDAPDGAYYYDERRVGETSLTILPMHVSAVLRLDELFRRTGIPLIPFGKIGFGTGLWWVDVGEETAQVGPDDDPIKGVGLSYGVHWAVGGMLALDWLGRRSMAALDQESGINHVHLFGEWTNHNLGLGANQMKVGTSTWTVGITFEM